MPFLIRQAQSTQTHTHMRFIRRFRWENRKPIENVDKDKLLAYRCIRGKNEYGAVTYTFVLYCVDLRNETTTKKLPSINSSPLLLLWLSSLVCMFFFLFLFGYTFFHQSFHHFAYEKQCALIKWCIVHKDRQTNEADRLTKKKRSKFIGSFYRLFISINLHMCV